MTCRICFEEDERKNLISPCLCSGNIKYVHPECLDKWRNTNTLNNLQCEICMENFIIEIVENGNIGYNLLCKLEIIGFLFLVLFTIFIIGKLIKLSNFGDIKIFENEHIDIFIFGLLFIMFMFGIICYNYMIFTNNRFAYNYLYNNRVVINNNIILLIVTIIGLFLILYYMFKFFVIIRKRHHINKNLRIKYIVKDREIL